MLPLYVALDEFQLSIGVVFVPLRFGIGCSFREKGRLTASLGLTNIREASSKQGLLDGYALRQVARLVYRALEFVRGVVGDELELDVRQNAGDVGVCLRDDEAVVCLL